VRAGAPGQPGPGDGCAGEQQELPPLDRHVQNSTHLRPIPPLIRGAESAGPVACTPGSGRHRWPAGCSSCSCPTTSVILTMRASQSSPSSASESWCPSVVAGTHGVAHGSGRQVARATSEVEPVLPSLTSGNAKQLYLARMPLPADLHGTEYGRPVGVCPRLDPMESVAVCPVRCLYRFLRLPRISNVIAALRPIAGGLRCRRSSTGRAGTRPGSGRPARPGRRRARTARRPRRAAGCPPGWPSGPARTRHGR
jgi:hypothetical protein